MPTPTGYVHQGHLDAARQLQAVRAIERSARTQARLVDELIDVSRVINGQLRLNITGVSLTTVIDAAIDALRPAADDCAGQRRREQHPPTGRSCLKILVLTSRVSGPLDLCARPRHAVPTGRLGHCHCGVDDHLRRRTS